jgi:hypothetical protein
LAVVADYEPRCVPVDLSLGPGTVNLAGPGCTLWTNPETITLAVAATPADFLWARLSPTLFTGTMLGAQLDIVEQLLQPAAGNEWTPLHTIEPVVLVGEPHDPVCEFEFLLPTNLAGDPTGSVVVSAPRTQGVRCVLSLATGQLKVLAYGDNQGRVFTFVFPETVLVANP